MGRRGVLAGTLVLFAANLATRGIGFLYRIYMSQAIGAEGMGLYQLFMPLYLLAWTITAAGFTTTVSRLTAQECARGEAGNSRRVLQIATLFSGGLGVLLGLSLYRGAGLLARLVFREERLIPSLRLLGLAFPCMAMGSCIRGYFHGLQEPEAPALSQVLEQTVRIAAVFLLIAHRPPESLAQACRYATAGIVAGEILSFLFVLVWYRRQKLQRTAATLSRREALQTVLAMALPLTANRMTGALLSTFENILIPQRLQLYTGAGESALGQYGQLTGMAMPLVQLPSALLLAVATALVPALSRALAVHNSRRIDAVLSRALLLSFGLAFGAAAVFWGLSSPLCRALYRQESLGPLVFKMGFLCPFLYVQITLGGILNGLGLHTFLLKMSVGSSLITMGFIYGLMPLFGLDAFLAGWLCALVVTVGLSMRRLAREAFVRLDLLNWVLKPGLSAGCAVLAGRGCLVMWGNCGWSLWPSLLLLLLVYAGGLHLSGCLRLSRLGRLCRQVFGSGKS